MSEFLCIIPSIQSWRRCFYVEKNCYSTFKLCYFTCRRRTYPPQKNSVSKPVVRSAQADFEDEYFSYFEENHSENEYSIKAKKKFGSDILSDYETVALTTLDEYEITYDLTADEETGEVVLNVYFDSTGESIVENFTGYYMTNYDGDMDVLFTIDDMHIFLSEIMQLSDEEQCSLAGNVLHKSVNLALKALVIIEPAIKILAYGGDAVKITLSTTIPQKASSDWAYNSKLAQPAGFVYGQFAYSCWKYGYSNLAFSGCEVIAGYNLCYALYQDRVLKNKLSLADAVMLFESLGIELGSADGFFGANPYQISYFLETVNIDYQKITSYKDFETKMKDNINYYVIISSWNDESVQSAIHTFLIDKDAGHLDKKYWAYNWKCSDTNEKSKYIYKKNDYEDYFEGGSVKSTFICAYFIEQ